MSGTDDEGTPPPGVPDEFAAAYQAAYDRALSDDGGDESDDGVERTDEIPEVRADPENPEDARIPEDAEPAVAGVPPDERRRQIDSGGSDRATKYAALSRFGDWRRERWFVPVVLVLAALLLVLAAYGLGRLFAGGGNDTAPPNTLSYPGSTAIAHPQSWHGPIGVVRPARASTGCTAAPGVNAAGRKVTYHVSNVLDRNPRTAWRCDGRAIGAKIVLHLDATIPVGQVGLVPGYAKTDRKSGADRYAQNNRITKVRWTIGNRQVVQTMSGSAKDRSLRTIRVPRTRTDTVTLEVLAVQQGPRNTTCISSVRIGKAVQH